MRSMVLLVAVLIAGCVTQPEWTSEEINAINTFCNDDWEEIARITQKEFKSSNNRLSELNAQIHEEGKKTGITTELTSYLLDTLDIKTKLLDIRLKIEWAITERDRYKLKSLAFAALRTIRRIPAVEEEFAEYQKIRGAR